MEREIVTELISIQHDVIRIVTASNSAYPLIEKYEPIIRANIERLKKLETDKGVKILSDFMDYLLDEGKQKKYCMLANLVESFLFEYSKEDEDAESVEPVKEEKTIKPVKKHRMKHWTKNEEKTLKEKYNTMGPDEIAVLLGRTPNAIKIKAFQLGITSHKRGRPKKQIVEKTDIIVEDKDLERRKKKIAENRQFLNEVCE